MLAFVIALVGAFVDGLSGTSGIVGPACAVCFVLACGAPAALARPDALRAAGVMPPLVFAVMALIASALQVSGQSLVHGTVYGFVQALATSPGAPMLYVGTAVGVGVVLTRRSRLRQGR